MDFIFYHAMYSTFVLFVQILSHIFYRVNKEKNFSDKYHHKNRYKYMKA